MGSLASIAISPIQPRDTLSGEVAISVILEKALSFEGP